MSPAGLKVSKFRSCGYFITATDHESAAGKYDLNKYLLRHERRMLSHVIAGGIFGIAIVWFMLGSSW